MEPQENVVTDTPSLDGARLPAWLSALRPGRVGLAYRARRYRWLSNSDEIGVIRSNLQAGNTAVDVGAYKGGITYWMSKSVGTEGRVVAFEPQPALAKDLSLNLALFSNVRVEGCAISGVEGRAFLQIPKRRNTGSASLEPGLHSSAVECDVSITTLDAYFRRYPQEAPALIKVDVEGHELEVFKGAENLLRTHKPVLVFECEQRHRGGQSVEPVFQYLQGLGYSEGQFISPEGLKPLSTFDPATMQDPDKSPYINMFVFSG